MFAKQIQQLGVGLLIFLLLAFVISYWLLTFLHVFSRFGIIPLNAVALLAVIIGIFVGVILTSFIFDCIDLEKKPKSWNKVLLNWPRMLLFYIISIICFVSLQAEVIMTNAELKELVNLEWSIFGLSITIFLVWNVLIIEYLRKKLPPKPENNFPTKVWKYIRSKEEFYTDTNAMFNSVTLLTINLFILVVATVMTYISFKEVSILSQNVVVLTLFFCSNTIIALFLDILKPLKDDKREMLKESQVTEEDLALRDEIAVQTNIVLEKIDIIQMDNDINPEEKEDAVHNLLDEFSQMFGTYSEHSDQDGLVL